MRWQSLIQPTWDSLSVFLHLDSITTPLSSPGLMVSSAHHGHTTISQKDFLRHLLNTVVSKYFKKDNIWVSTFLLVQSNCKYINILLSAPFSRIVTKHWIFVSCMQISATGSRNQGYQISTSCQFVSFIQV